MFLLLQSGGIKFKFDEVWENLAEHNCTLTEEARFIPGTCVGFAHNTAVN